VQPVHCMHANFIDTVTLARPASDFIWLDEKYRSLSFRFRFIYYANEYDTCTRNRYRKPEKLVPFSDSFFVAYQMKLEAKFLD